MGPSGQERDQAEWAFDAYDDVDGQEAGAYTRPLFSSS
jgi:hypothetical protein